MKVSICTDIHAAIAITIYFIDTDVVSILSLLIQGNLNDKWHSTVIDDN